jgi:hypothetical protein
MAKKNGKVYNNTKTKQTNFTFNKWKNKDHHPTSCGNILQNAYNQWTKFLPRLLSRLSCCCSRWWLVGCWYEFQLYQIGSTCKSYKDHLAIGRQLSSGSTLVCCETRHVLTWKYKTENNNKCITCSFCTKKVSKRINMEQIPLARFQSLRERSLSCESQLRRFQPSASRFSVSTAAACPIKLQRQLPTIDCKQLMN